MPLVVFNTYNLKYVYNYYEKLREFERLQLVDEENLAENEVPHYFKTVYVPDDKFLIIGGLERESSVTSQRCFLLDEKGKLSVTTDMHVGRQYITVCADYPNNTIYVIGGYSSELGVLSSFETFNIPSRKWTLSNENNNQNLTTPRINAAACKCGPKHVYVFGGIALD